MLTTQAIESALALTQRVDASGVTLDAVAESPLAQLVRAGRASASAPIGASGTFEINTGEIEYLANQSLPGMDGNQHDMILDDVSEFVARAVQDHVAFARSVVAPKVDELTHAVRQAVDNIPASALSQVEVIQYNPPAPLTDASLLASLESFDGLPFLIPELNVKMPIMTAQELRTFMETGSATLDKSIVQWLVSKGDAWLLEIYQHVFQNPGMTAKRDLSFRDWLNRDTDTMLAIYLIARNAVNNTPEGVEMSQAAFEAAMVMFRGQSGAALARFVEHYNQDLRSGMLVKSYTRNTITVHGQIYREWLDAGGSNEALYGNLMQSPVIHSAERLLEEAPRLKKAWESHYEIAHAVYESNRILHIREMLGTQFLISLNTPLEGESGDELVKIRNLFDQELRRVTDLELADLYTAVLRLVCRSRFYRTDAERILGGIELVRKRNRDLPVREAAMLAVVNYVVHWVANQMQVVDPAGKNVAVQRVGQAFSTNAA